MSFLAFALTLAALQAVCALVALVWPKGKTAVSDPLDLFHD